MSTRIVRPLAGIAMVAVIAAAGVLAAAMFTGATTDAATVTVVAPRAGLVMDADAKVQMRGVTVGRVSEVRYDAADTATIDLAIEPDQMSLIPADVEVRIAAPTVFGAKSVEFVMPAPSARGKTTPDPVTGQPTLTDGQVLTVDDVSIEVNTVFGDLTRVLSRIRPAELNAALSAISTGLDGRGDQFGQTLSDANSYLGDINSTLPQLRSLLHDVPEVLEVYADTTPPLMSMVDNVSAVSDTLVAEQKNLDAFLTGVIGLSDTGTRVLGDNRGRLANALSVLAPTLALTDEYNEALNCSLNGFADLSESPPADVPGLGLSANFLWGAPPYDPKKNLPKVAATGGPQCSMLPVAFQEKPPFVVADTGANPQDPTRNTVELNVDSLRDALFGPIPDGEPRKAAAGGGTR